MDAVQDWSEDVVEEQSTQLVSCMLIIIHYYYFNSVAIAELHNNGYLNGILTNKCTISYTRIVQSFEEFASTLVQQDDFLNITVIAEETVLQAQSVSCSAYIKDED